MYSCEASEDVLKAGDELPVIGAYHTAAANPKSQEPSAPPALIPTTNSADLPPPGRMISALSLLNLIPRTKSEPSTKPRREYRKIKRAPALPPLITSPSSPDKHSDSVGVSHTKNNFHAFMELLHPQTARYTEQSYDFLYRRHLLALGAELHTASAAEGASPTAKAFR